jgi:uncharacterized protein (TIGR03067 family)
VRSRVLIVASAILLLGADGPKQDAKKELDRLQGNWRLVGTGEGGKKQDIDFDKAPPMPIKGDRLKDVPYEGKKLEMLVELDPSQEPKAIVLTYVSPDGKEKGDSFLGIYSLEGDVLKIYLNPNPPGQDNKRPKQFATKGEGAALFMWVLKRDKK